MSAKKAAPDLEPVPPEPEGLSAFGARVLNQLSLSAWLPAGFLALSVVVLVQFRRQKSLDLGSAFLALSNKDQVWGLALFAVPVLVVTTLITQAFAFEAIRLLEGYWHRSGPASLVSGLMIRHQVRRKDRLSRAMIDLSHKAFMESRKRWLDDTPSEVVDALERASIGLDYDEALDEAIGESEWWDRARPWRMRRVEGLEEAVSEFPIENRILPTRLGNLLRSVEDRLEHTDGDLATFAMRRRSLVSLSVRTQHDQFRTRLEMYCILALVAAFVAAGAVPLLWAICGVGKYLVAAGCLLVAWTSYQAAITSARGYAVTLRFMDQV